MKVSLAPTSIPQQRLPCPDVALGRTVVTSGNAGRRRYWALRGCSGADRTGGLEMEDFERKSAMFTCNDTLVYSRST